MPKNDLPSRKLSLSTQKNEFYDDLKTYLDAKNQLGLHKISCLPYENTYFSISDLYFNDLIYNGCHFYLTLPSPFVNTPESHKEKSPFGGL